MRRIVSSPITVTSCSRRVRRDRDEIRKHRTKYRDTNLEKMAFVRSKVSRGKTVYEGYFLSPRCVFVACLARLAFLA